MSVLPTKQMQLELGLIEEAPPIEDLDEQYTPPSVFDPLMREFQFTLDPCSTAESAKTKHFFTAKENGLRQSWAGQRVFENPPYSNIPVWMEKTQEEMEDACQCVVALLPAWTDRKWWHTYIESERKKRGGPEVRFIKGRIVFGYPGNPTGLKRGPGGKRRGGGKFPSVLVIWRAPGLVIPDPRQLDWVQDPNRGR